MAAANNYPYPLTGLKQNSINNRLSNVTLGKGAFGRVNREKVNDGRGVVATKYFLPEQQPDFSSYVNEVAIMKYLKGKPNVAQYIGLANKNVGKNPLDFPAIVMGAADMPLSDKTLYTSWDKIYATVKGILNGYYVMHELGVIHRDTKPQNMLMTKSNQVWITDFGESRYVSNTIETPHDYYTGTRWWAAPEVLMKSWLNNIQALDEANKPETVASLKAIDAWAVGCSLIDILTSNPAPYFSYQPVDSEDERITAIKTIFNKMGLPTESDGSTKRVYDNFLEGLTKKGIVPPTVVTPITPRDYINANRNPNIDPANSDFLNVCTLIEGLLNYNPDNRLTIAQALERLDPALAPNKIPTPPLYPGILSSLPGIPPIDLTKFFVEIRNICFANEVYEEQGASWTKKPYKEEFKNLRYTIIDRAYTFLVNYALTKHNLNDPKYIGLSGSVVNISLAILNPYLYVAAKSQEIDKDILNEILMTQVLLGKTRLDEMCEKNNNKNAQNLGLLNMICFHFNLYNKYSEQIPKLCAVLIELANVEDGVAAAAATMSLTTVRAKHYNDCHGAIVERMGPANNQKKGGKKTKQHKKRNKKGKNRTRRHKVE